MSIPTDLSGEDIHTLVHACGLTDQIHRATPNIYRDHYVCPEDDPAVAGLVARGYMALSGRPTWCGGDVVYRVTEQGRAAALLWWHEQRTARTARTSRTAKRSAARAAKRTDEPETPR